MSDTITFTKPENATEQDTAAAYMAVLTAKAALGVEPTGMLDMLASEQRENPTGELATDSHVPHVAYAAAQGAVFQMCKGGGLDFEQSEAKANDLKSVTMTWQPRDGVDGWLCDFEFNHGEGTAELVLNDDGTTDVKHEGDTDFQHGF